MICFQFSIGGLCKTCARCTPAGSVYVFDCPVRNTIQCHFYEPKAKDELAPVFMLNGPLIEQEAE